MLGSHKVILPELRTSFMGMLGGARSFLLPKKDSVDGMLPSHPILLAVVRRGNKCTCKIHELKYIMPGRRVLPCVCVGQ